MINGNIVACQPLSLLILSLLAFHITTMRTQNLLTISSVLGAAAAAKPDAQTMPKPPMGFNNWARYMTNINESIFVDAANAMTTNGLLASGYNRINLDDAWSLTKRNSTGSMVWDSAKFPQGLIWLTSWLKSKGYIPGIYSDAGTLSCAAVYPGTIGHEDQDLHDFAAWGFEYLKLDGCNVADYYNTYQGWLDRLAAFNKGKTSGRVAFSNSAPAYFSSPDDLNGWYIMMMQAASGGQLARHCGDIATYSDEPSWSSVMWNYGWNMKASRFQQPGYFNDPDFLIADHPGLTLDEKRTQFALWCSMSSPLIISADIPKLPSSTLAYLNNKDLIAVNQDSLAQQATFARRTDTWDVITKSLSNGDRLVTVLNKGSTSADLNVSWFTAGIEPDAGSTLSVRSLWTGKTRSVAASAGGLTARAVPSHGTAVFRVSGKFFTVPTGQVWNTQSNHCLTDSANGSATWTTCTGSDAQIWTLNTYGQISSGINPEWCLGNYKGEAWTWTDCGSNSWQFPVSGNVVHQGTNQCLTENSDGSASVTDCGYVTNPQVFGVPAGVSITY